jgi:very-short-patch-repair endonuclease
VGRSKSNHSMPAKKIVTQQHVAPEMLSRAIELRRKLTPAERKLWQHLRAGRLEGYHFRRQQVIEPYIVDFYCHAASLVVELDGGSHLEQAEYDRQRDEHLTARGLRVMRFYNSDVDREIETVLVTILDACRAGDVGEID